MNINVIQARPFQLAEPITNDTEITVKNLFDIYGNKIVMSGEIQYGTLEPQSRDNQEIFSYTGIVALTATTDKLTGVTRGLDAQPDPITGLYGSDPSQVKSHAANSEVILSDNPQVWDKKTSKDEEETITEEWTFEQSPIVPTPDSPMQAVNKDYADTLAILGGTDASTTAKGIARLTASPNVTLGTFTVTIATPGVFTLATHGLTENDTVQFTTDGDLPTGLLPSVTYYVIAAGLTATEFQVSATYGGGAVATSGSQSGVHTAIRTTPRAVSENDTRLPTQDENNALVGTSGTAVSSSNKLVDNADTRLANFGGTGADGALNVTSGTTTLNLGQVYNFTTINVSVGATLGFTGSGAALLNATGAVTIAGTIELTKLSGVAEYIIATKSGFTAETGTPYPSITVTTETGGTGGTGGNAAGGTGGTGGNAAGAGIGAGGAGGTAPNNNGGAGQNGNNTTGGGGGGGGGSNSSAGTSGGNASGLNGGVGGSGAVGTTTGGGGGGGGAGYSTGNGGAGGVGGSTANNGANSGNGGNSGANGGNGGAGGACTYSPGTGGNGGNGYSAGGNGGAGGGYNGTNYPGGNGGNGGNTIYGAGGTGGAGGSSQSGPSPGVGGAGGHSRFGTGGTGGAGGYAAGTTGGTGGRGGDGITGGAGGQGGGTNNYTNGTGGRGGDGKAGSTALIFLASSTVNFTGTINAFGGNGGNGGAVGTGGTGGTAGVGGNGGNGADVIFLSVGAFTNAGTINNAGGTGGIGSTAGTTGTAGVKTVGQVNNM